MAKLNYLKAKQMGASDDQIMKYAQSRGIEIKLPEEPKPEKKGRGLLDLLSVATSIGGGALGSAVAPGVGTVAGSAIGGGLGELLEQMISGEKTDLGGAGKEALWSGAGGIAGLGIGKVLGGGATKLAQGTRKAIINPKLGGSLTAGKEDDVVNTISKYAKGSAVSIRNKSPKIVGDLETKIQETFKGYNPKVDAKTAQSTLSQYLDDVAAYDMSDKAFANAAKVQLRKISGLKTAQEVHAYKQKLNGMLKSVSFEGGRTPTQREAVLMATRSSLDDLLTKTAPKIKNLTKDQSAFYAADKGITKSAGENFNLPFSNIPIPGSGRLLQGTASKVAEGGEKLGNSQLLQQLMGQGTARTLMPRGGDTAEFDTTGAIDGEILPQESPTGSKTGKMSELLQQLALMDMMQGGKNVNKIIALSKFIEPPITEAQKGQVAQVQAAYGLVDQLENAYMGASKGGQTGFGIGPLSGLLGGVSGGAVNQEAALYNSLRKGFTALIARATGERGVLTDADAARALELLPSLNDTPELAANKITQIREVFRNAEARIGANSGGGQDVMSLLEGLQ